MSESFEGEKLLRAEFQDLEAYDPKFTPVAINLSANENAYGLPAEVKERFSARMRELAIERYPLPLANELRETLAADFGISPNMLMLGNGGDELIFNLLLAYGGPESMLVTAPPDFSVYGLYAQLTSTPHICVPRDSATFELDMDAIIECAKEAKLVFLTSPNNPTGNLIEPMEVARLCETCKALVLLDEAYIEFAPQGASAQSLLSRYKNLILLRTFSKAFALAGARVGYVMGDASIIDGLARVRQPYSVNVLSQQLALEAYAQRARLSESVEALKTTRDKLIAEFEQIDGIQVWKSAANFVLVRIDDAHSVWQELRDKYSILVRDFSAADYLKDCLRITVGTEEECGALVAALSEILARRER